MPENTILLNSKQAAELLNCTPAALEAWRHRKVGPPYKKLGTGRGGMVRYDKAKLLDWIEKQEVEVSQ